MWAERPHQRLHVDHIVLEWLAVALLSLLDFVKKTLGRKLCGSIRWIPPTFSPACSRLGSGRMCWRTTPHAPKTQMVSPLPSNLNDYSRTCLATFCWAQRSVLWFSFPDLHFSFDPPFVKRRLATRVSPSAFVSKMLGPVQVQSKLLIVRDVSA